MDKSDKDLKNVDNSWWKPAMFFYSKVTSWIILPLIVAFFTGKYFKKSTGSEVLFFILIFFAFCITCFGIYREIKIYQKSIFFDKKEDKKE